MIATITNSMITIADLKGTVLSREHRPASFGEADTMLAAHGYGRTGEWELSADSVIARVERIDNTFNDVTAARLWKKIGVTHDDFELVSAQTVQNGDLVTDSERSAAYVVAGSSISDGRAKLHMVGEGKTWDDRYTMHFTVIWAARKRS